MIHGRPTGASAPPSAGSAFLAEIYQVHAEVTEELWAGHDDRVVRLVEALGGLLAYALVLADPGRGGFGLRRDGSAVRAGRAPRRGAAAQPAGHAAVPAGGRARGGVGRGGHTAASIAELAARGGAAGIELETDRRAAGPYVVLDRRGAADDARRPGGPARLRHGWPKSALSRGAILPGDPESYGGGCRHDRDGARRRCGAPAAPYTDTLPKALVPVDGETTILDIALRNLAEVGLTEVVIVVGYAADAVVQRQAALAGEVRRDDHAGAQRQGRGVEQRRTRSGWPGSTSPAACCWSTATPCTR